MDRPAYERDAYLTTLDTEVVTTGNSNGTPWAECGDTVFYPEGGGQPADLGLLAGVAVIDVQHHGGAVRHILERPVETGSARLEIDWQRRFDHMQQHTAQHLLTAVALREKGWRTTAFHLGDRQSDIELDVPRLDRADLDRLEAVVAAEIYAAHPVHIRHAEPEEMERLGVRSRLLPDGHEGPLRLVEIEDIDLNTCGGTHVRSTAEIGALSLLGTEQIRGGTRVFFVAGDRARRRMAEHEARLHELRTVLGACDDELADIVTLRVRREKDLARDRRRLIGELGTAWAAVLAARPGAVVNEHFEHHDMELLRAVAGSLVDLAAETVALLTAGTPPDQVFVIAAGPESGCDLREVGPAVAALLEGRGGGPAGLFQGKAGSLAGRDEALAALTRSVIES